jgi:hypothetical protein
MIIVFLILGVTSGKAQTLIDSSEESTLIVGTWLPENSSIAEKWVFSPDNVLKEYTNGSIDSTYYWEIVGESNSGVKSHYLELINQKDANDKKYYESSAVNSERLVLIYQREYGWGTSKPAIYYRLKP